MLRLEMIQMLRQEICEAHLQVIQEPLWQEIHESLWQVIQNPLRQGIHELLWQKNLYHEICEQWLQ